VAASSYGLFVDGERSDRPFFSGRRDHRGVASERLRSRLSGDLPRLRSVVVEVPDPLLRQSWVRIHCDQI
jgi:hypothetical protein